MLKFNIDRSLWIKISNITHLPHDFRGKNNIRRYTLIATVIIAMLTVSIISWNIGYFVNKDTTPYGEFNPEKTCFVSPSFSNDASLRQFSTIQAGIDFAISEWAPTGGARATVFVYAGVYNEQIHTPSGVNIVGVERSGDGASAKIVNIGSNSSNYPIRSTSEDYYRIWNMRFEASSSDNIIMEIGGTRGRFKDCNFNKGYIKENNRTGPSYRTVSFESCDFAINSRIQLTGDWYDPIDVWFENCRIMTKTLEFTSTHTGTDISEDNVGQVRFLSNSWFGATSPYIGGDWSVYALDSQIAMGTRNGIGKNKVVGRTHYSDGVNIDNVHDGFLSTYAENMTYLAVNVGEDVYDTSTISYYSIAVPDVAAFNQIEVDLPTLQGSDDSTNGADGTWTTLSTISFDDWNHTGAYPGFCAPIKLEAEQDYEWYRLIGLSGVADNKISHWNLWMEYGGKGRMVINTTRDVFIANCYLPAGIQFIQQPSSIIIKGNFFQSPRILPPTPSSFADHWRGFDGKDIICDVAITGADYSGNYQNGGLDGNFSCSNTIKPVSKKGIDSYASLQDAINSINKEGCVISLTEDISIEDELILGNYPIFINGHDTHSITSISETFVIVLEGQNIEFYGLQKINIKTLEISGNNTRVHIEDCGDINNRAIMLISITGGNNNSYLNIIDSQVQGHSAGLYVIHHNNNYTNVYVERSTLIGYIGNPVIKWTMIANYTWISKYSTFIHGSSGANYWCENDALGGGDIIVSSSFDTMNHGSLYLGDDPPRVVNSILNSMNIADNSITY